MTRAPGGETLIRSRLAKVQPLDAFAAQWLVGLFEAEGHLGIVPNNGGRSWRCLAALALRDDDGQILADLQGRTQLGHLEYVPARNGSRPQIRWTIASKIECEQLARLFSYSPMRGRKRLEAEVWSDAVSIWSAQQYGVPRQTRARLEHRRLQLLRLRRYDPRLDVAVDLGPTESLAAWLGGFATGEAWFGLADRQARFVIKLRADDEPLLRALADRFEVGRAKRAGNEPPASSWLVCARGDLLRLIRLFDAASLAGRKRRQYEAWRPGARELYAAHIGGRAPDIDVLSRTRTALAEAGRYAPGTFRPFKRRAICDVDEAYIAAVRAWAQTVTGPLTVTRYRSDCVSRRDLPGASTLWMAFGSWPEVLDAAGLRARAHSRSAA